MDLFELNGRVVVDLADAVKAFDTISKEGEQTQSKLSKFFSGVGKGAAVVGKTIGAGLVAGGTAMAGLTVKAMNLGGELEQNMGGSEAVFKDYAGKMQETAKDAFSNMGLSTSDFLGTANKMGALFQGAGFSIEESSDLASNAMQRAADVASIMGIDTSAAMEAIAGAAKGNFTMMDNLGVAMNDTTLQAYALSKGIDKSTSEMTNQEKIGLAMEMFMEKTAYAAGNYAKENETLAGSLGTAKSALTNFLDGSGDVDQLVTAFSNAAKVIVKNIKELAPRLVSGITDIVNQVIPMLPPLLQQLLPTIIEGAVALINGLVNAMPTIISALLDALPALIDGVMQVVNALIAALPQLVEAVVSALPSLIPHLVNGLVSMIVMLCTMLPDIIQPIIDNLPMIIESIVTALIENTPQLIWAGIQLLWGLFEGMLSLIGKIPEIIGKIFSGIWNGIKSLFGIHSPSTVMAEVGKFIMEGLFNGIKSLLGMISEIWNKLKEITLAVFNAIKDGIMAVWDAIKNAVMAVVEAIKNVVITVWNAIKTAITTVVNAIKNVVTSVWNGIKNIVSSVVNGIKNVVVNVWNAIKNAISNVLNGIKNTFSNIWNGIKNTVSNVVNGIKNTVSNIFSGLKNTVSNIWNGIKSAITAPIEGAKNIIKGIIDKIKGFFNFDFKLPKIKLPHFSIKPKGWSFGDLFKGSIPSLGIEWYAKAMDNPMVMDKPTIFGYNPETGNLQGGGEAGSEVVSGTGTLLSMIGDVVETKTAAQNDRIVTLLSAILEAVVGGNDDLLKALLAGQVMVLDNREVARTVRQYA